MAFDDLIAKALKLLAEQNFPFRVMFDIPGTKNEGFFCANKSYIQPGNFCFEVHAARKGSMYSTQHKVMHMNEQDMRKTLKEWADSQTERDKLKAELKELSDSVDDKEGEFPSDY